MQVKPSYLQAWSRTWGHSSRTVPRWEGRSQTWPTPRETFRLPSLADRRSPSKVHQKWMRSISFLGPLPLSNSSATLTTVARAHEQTWQRTSRSSWSSGRANGLAPRYYFALTWLEHLSTSFVAANLFQVARRGLKYHLHWYLKMYMYGYKQQNVLS